MAVILGGDCRELAFGRAEFAHVALGKGRIKLHERAYYPWSAPRRGREAVPDRAEPLGNGLRLVDVPSAVEDGRRFEAILVKHLLCADHESDIGGTGAKMVDRLIERGGAAGAGVFDVHNRDGLDSDLSQRDLATNQMLPLDNRLGRVREECGLDIGGPTASILERLQNGFGYKRFQGPIQPAAEAGHTDANYKDFFLHDTCSLWGHYRPRKFGFPPSRAARKPLPSSQVAVCC